MRSGVIDTERVESRAPNSVPLLVLATVVALRLVKLMQILIWYRIMVALSLPKKLAQSIQFPKVAGGTQMVCLLQGVCISFCGLLEAAQRFQSTLPRCYGCLKTRRHGTSDHSAAYRVHLIGPVPVAVIHTWLIRWLPVLAS